MEQTASCAEEMYNYCVILFTYETMFMMARTGSNELSKTGKHSKCYPRIPPPYAWLFIYRLVAKSDQIKCGRACDFFYDWRHMREHRTWLMQGEFQMVDGLGHAELLSP